MNQSPGISLSPSSVSAPVATPAPIHDIIGPLPFFPYPWWVVALAVAALLLLLGALIWGIRKFRQAPPLTSREVAIRALAALRDQLTVGSDHDFGVLVSGFSAVTWAKSTD